MAAVILAVATVAGHTVETLIGAYTHPLAGPTRGSGRCLDQCGADAFAYEAYRIWRRTTRRCPALARLDTVDVTQPYISKVG
jgi:hypothetical protein